MEDRNYSSPRCTEYIKLTTLFHSSSEEARGAARLHTSGEPGRPGAFGRSTTNSSQPVILSVLMGFLVHVDTAQRALNSRRLPTAVWRHALFLDPFASPRASPEEPSPDCPHLIRSGLLSLQTSKHTLELQKWRTIMQAISPLHSPNQTLVPCLRVNYRMSSEAATQSSTLGRRKVPSTAARRP